MQIGNTVICKHNGQLIECTVIKMTENDLFLDYKGETLIRRFWEVKKWIPEEPKDEEN